MRGLDAGERGNGVPTITGEHVGTPRRLRWGLRRLKSKLVWSQAASSRIAIPNRSPSCCQTR